MTDETELERLRVEVVNLKGDRAELLEELRGFLIPDKGGTLHNPDCIGVYGYDCRAWCACTRELIERIEAHP